MARGSDASYLFLDHDLLISIAVQLLNEVLENLGYVFHRRVGILIEDPASVQLLLAFLFEPYMFFQLSNVFYHNH